MLVHFCSTAASGARPAPLRALERIVPTGELFRYRSPMHLAQGLRGRGWGDVVVLLVRSDRELDQLTAAAQALEGHRLLLLVHDSEPATLAKGHALRPRLLLCPPVAPATVAAVVGRMRAGNRDPEPAFSLPAYPWDGR